MNNFLPREFYDRPALTVARELLGKYLVRLEDGQRLAGIILETEAYCGEGDLGCHCKAGRTTRTQVMYGPPGHAYVYFTYGKHWMLNFVVEPEGNPAAILIRAIEPLEGMDFISARRGSQPMQKWTDGPAKICQALNIDKRFNGVDLCAEGGVLIVEDAEPVPKLNVKTGPRVGLNSVPEPWKSVPWRYRVNSPQRSQRHE